MKTHTELLNQLIDAVYALPFTTFKEAHDLQMLATEIKGQIMAACEHCDSPPFAQSDYATTQPDADGWIKNTGVMPEIEVLELRFRDGHICNDPAPKTQYRWHFANNCQDPSVDITHYKPA
jgi:hypothetical protein